MNDLDIGISAEGEPTAAVAAGPGRMYCASMDSARKDESVTSATAEHRLQQFASAEAQRVQANKHR